MATKKRAAQLDREISAVLSRAPAGVPGSRGLLDKYLQIANYAARWAGPQSVNPHPSLRPYLKRVPRGGDRQFWLGEVLDELRRAASNELTAAEMKRLNQVMGLIAAPPPVYGTRVHATMKADTTSSTEARPLKEKLQQAAKWIRRELSKRSDSSHPSHLAGKVLEEADEKFKLGSFGVEGWAKSPSLGYQYLNYGDPYDATIVVRSNPTRATVHVALGGWASYAGNA